MNSQLACVVSVQKYAEIITTSVKEQVDFSHMDFSKKVDIFYGCRDCLFELINENDFNNYSLVCRLVNFEHKDNKNYYHLRFLKSDKNDFVDFFEEQLNINSHICSYYDGEWHLT